ncbi:MAG: FHA domain-containing protein [Muribaculaceae bacterium]|nr:FHA domain-containing protein [Muribaculaceae bacterium]
MKVITIGRSAENNIIINDAKVSRTHLQLVLNDNGACSVVDLNSANGTFVNGQKITGEVCLQPNDIICIGNTTLPWHEYIQTSVKTSQKSMDNVLPKSGHNKTLWYVVACVIFVLLVCGIGIYYYNGKNQEKIETEKRNQKELQKELLRQEAEQKADDVKRLQDEADESFRQALISQRDKSNALAESKQKEAIESKKQAVAAAAAQHKAESARIAAENAMKDANIAKVAAEQSSKEAIKKVEDKASQAISKANAERDFANEKSKLTERFYEEYAEMDKNLAKGVCQKLNIKLAKNEDAKTMLKSMFNNAENKDKQTIINVIQALKNQNDKTNKKNKPEVESDTVIIIKNDE